MNRIAAALISRIAASIADRMFDVLIRTMILEGAAGIQTSLFRLAFGQRFYLGNQSFEVFVDGDDG
jgi:hypothetical protein